jgi:cytochrome c5
MKKLATATLLAVVLGSPAHAFDVEAKYTQACGACHGMGVAGAPKAFDKAAWESRLATGMDALVASVKNGKGAMPPRGLCMDCTDDQYKALITYMSTPK